MIAANTRVISHYFDDTMIELFDPGKPESLAETIVSSFQNWDAVLEKKKTEISKRKLNECTIVSISIIVTQQPAFPISYFPLPMFKFLFLSSYFQGPKARKPFAGVCA